MFESISTISLRSNLAIAKGMIEKMGYGQREVEVEELQRALDQTT